MTQIFPEQCAPRIMSIEEIKNYSGKIDLFLKKEAAVKLFPNLMKRCFHQKIASILATTRLVGVECPGFHSLYSELEIAESPASQTKTLDFEVIKTDKRFNLVKMKLTAPDIKSKIKAFLRPSPKAQPTFLELKNWTLDKTINKSIFFIVDKHLKKTALDYCLFLILLNFGVLSIKYYFSKSKSCNYLI